MIVRAVSLTFYKGRQMFVCALLLEASTTLSLQSSKAEAPHHEIDVPSACSSVSLLLNPIEVSVLGSRHRNNIEARSLVHDDLKIFPSWEKLVSLAHRLCSFVSTIAAMPRNNRCGDFAGDNL